MEEMTIEYVVGVIKMRIQLDNIEATTAARQLMEEYQQCIKICADNMAVVHHVAVALVMGTIKL